MTPPGTGRETSFDPHCRDCPRLAEYRDRVKQQHPDYHCRPVPAVGPGDSRLLVVGLAPGMHGANATGRPFTGDYAGVLLYRTLFETGFSNQAHSRHIDDGLRLHDCRITNAVKCLPPANKPTGVEIRNCNGFLARELAEVAPRVVIALGRVAHDAVLRALGCRLRDFPFRHGEVHVLPGAGPTVVDSYHCSRYNTQTRRLTPEMFRQTVLRARALLPEAHNPGQEAEQSG